MSVNVAVLLGHLTRKVVAQRVTFLPRNGGPPAPGALAEEPVPDWVAGEA